jgi:hypothetical protein
VLAIMKLSRYFAVGELLVIVLPLAMLALWSTLLILPLGVSALLSDGLKAFPVALLGLFCAASLCSLVSGAALAAQLLRFGASALPRAPKVLWALLTIGVLLAVAGGIMALVGEGIGFAVGLPALIPAAHLYLERRREMANNSFNRNPLRGSG